MTLVKFNQLANVPVHYDRFPDPYQYGSRGKAYNFYAMPEFINKLESFFNELWAVCPYGQAQIITSGGAYVDKSGYHGLGRAFDLDGIFWNNYTFITKTDGINSNNRLLYFAIECILRKHFGLVLDYCYNSDHHDHFHLDDSQPINFRSKKAQIKFLQASLIYVFNESVGNTGIDGVFGNHTINALNNACNLLNINNVIQNQTNWLKYLEETAKYAFNNNGEVMINEQ